MTSTTLRGGSWNNNPRNVRVSNRNRNSPGERNNNIGFRCVGDGRRPWDEGESRSGLIPAAGGPSCDPEAVPGRVHCPAEHYPAEQAHGLASW